jgi:hypothetical protein
MKISKSKEIEISGHVVKTLGGWKTICIHGTAYDRGFAHGFLLYEELQRTLFTYPFLVDYKVHTTHQKYIKTSNKLIKPVIIKEFPEIYEELEGIAAGAQARGISISVDFLIAWNSHSSLQSYFEKKRSKCSAFIATGNATKDGKIVMAHTTHTNFAEAQLYNIVVFMIPQKGEPFVMQTAAGLVASVSDWFLCSTGIIGCETTISSISYKPQFGAPFFCRIRTAMQYAKTLDDYAKIMQTNNAGDYACSWLFGNINTNEIMLFELGLKECNIKTTQNGVFYGMNSAMDEDLRLHETHDTHWNNISTSSGARTARFNELLYGTYYQKLDVESAKLILSDHHDVFLHKDIKNRRSICVHSESDGESKTRRNFLHGCTDCKITTTDMAKTLEFMGRFGSACGRKFSIKQHVKKYPEYKSWEKYVNDMKTQKWVKISFR